MKRFRYPTNLHRLYYKFRNSLLDSSIAKKLRRLYLQQKYDTHNMCDSLTWISPQEILSMQVESDYTSCNFRTNYDRVVLHSPDKARFNPTIYAGLCIGGNWDKYTKPHEYDKVYKGLKKHIEDHTNLENTEYGYQYRLRQRTYQVDSYMERQIEITKELVDSIKKEGYQTRYELDQLDENDPPYLRKEQWGITVNIDRNGKYIFNNTAHNRLAISKILELDKVPVTVVVVHSKAFN